MRLDNALALVQRGEPLTRAQAAAAFGAVLTPGDPTRDAQLAGLLAVLATRGETADEIAGCADALRAAALPFEHDAPSAIDTCGTGGDGKGTFNLSTASALVAAGAGARVVKHGNRAVSSRSGSADLLESAGASIDVSPRVARAALEASGFTFLFAPRYHPALRHAAPVREALGIRTIFNLVGPLVNPGRVRRQLLGVAEPRLVELFAASLRGLGLERGAVVHGAGGIDELALEPGNRLRGVGSLTTVDPEAETLGLARAPLEALRGGTPTENLRTLRRLLDGESGPLRDVVLLNAGIALVVADIADDPRGGVEAARDSIDSGRARGVLERYVETTRTLGEEEAA